MVGSRSTAPRLSWDIGYEVYAFFAYAKSPFTTLIRTIDSPRLKALRDFLVGKRKEAGLRQVDLAKRLKRRQDYVSYVETGQKLVEVVELMEWAEAIGFDARDAIKALAKIRK